MACKINWAIDVMSKKKIPKPSSKLVTSPAPFTNPATAAATPAVDALSGRPTINEPTIPATRINKAIVSVVCLACCSSAA